MPSPELTEEEETARLALIELALESDGLFFPPGARCGGVPYVDPQAWTALMDDLGGERRWQTLRKQLAMSVRDANAAWSLIDRIERPAVRGYYVALVRDLRKGDRGADTLVRRLERGSGSPAARR